MSRLRAPACSGFISPVLSSASSSPPVRLLCSAGRGQVRGTGQSAPRPGRLPTAAGRRQSPRAAGAAAGGRAASAPACFCLLPPPHSPTAHTPTRLSCHLQCPFTDHGAGASPPPHDQRRAASVARLRCLIKPGFDRAAWQWRERERERAHAATAQLAAAHSPTPLPPRQCASPTFKRPNPPSQSKPRNSKHAHSSHSPS